MKLWQAVFAAVLLRGFAAAAETAPVYENRGNTIMPTIDAVTFLNRGVFSIASGDQPYDTQGTLYYTNFAGATIDGSGGFKFDHVNATDGLRGSAASFANFGTIRLGSASSGFFPGGGGGGLLFPSFNSAWLLVNASNIVNRGGLTVSSSGLIKLQGSTVNLSRSGVRAGEDPFEPIQQGIVIGDGYRNDAGVSDLYWGVGQNNVLDPAGPGPFDLAVLAGTRPASGPHEVLVSSGLTNTLTLTATNAFAFTNQVSPTNWVIQAVYVNTNSSDPQFKVAVKFGNPRTGNIPGAKMPIVQFTFEDVDTITTEPYTNYVYLLDSLGAMTNGVLYTNMATQVDQRPSNFIVTRVTPREWTNAVPTNAIYKSDMIYNASYASQTVTNSYAGYRAQIGQSTSTGGGGGGGGGFFFGTAAQLSHPTNEPGRVEIEADKLDLTLSRFRTDGLLSIKASDVVGVPYKLDAAVINVDVSRPRDPLVVSNLIQPIVRRFNGTVSAWSAVWTNQTFTTAPDPANPGTMLTNTVDIRTHALIVSHQFVTRQTVQTYQFAAHTPYLILRDNLTLRERLLVDAPDVDLWARVSVGTNPVAPANFPRIVNLTNRVELSSSSSIRLGTGTNLVAKLVNNGIIAGSLIELGATEFSHAGEISSSVGDASISSRNLKFDAGAFYSAANIWITADDFKAANSKIRAGYEARNVNSGNTNYFLGSLTLDVATRLTDEGPAATNVWTVYDGFSLVRKPAEGDLLGTIMVSKLGRFAEAVHAWAAEDRGPEAAGYTNNAAVGQLELNGRQFGLFTFRSATGQPAAMYVDRLQFSNSATNVDLALNIEPGFTLYFADSNLDPGTLDGAFDGRLRWVKGYAGARSVALATLSSGHSIRVNRGLLLSEIVDSDGDGIANAFDGAPFEPQTLRIAVRVFPGSPARAEITWAASLGSRYRVEQSSGVHAGDWRTLITTDAASEVSVPMSVIDELSNPGEQKFYRVVELR